MQKVTFDLMPSFIEQMAVKIDKIETLLSEKQPPKIDTSKRKYKLPEAALYCGMSEPAFRTYIYKRKVAGTKFAKAWLFLEEDLDKFIKDYRKPTADELKTKALNLMGRVK